MKFKTIGLLSPEERQDVEFIGAVAFIGIMWRDYETHKKYVKEKEK